MKRKREIHERKRETHERKKAWTPSGKERKEYPRRVCVKDREFFYHPLGDSPQDRGIYCTRIKNITLKSAKTSFDRHVNRKDHTKGRIKFQAAGDRLYIRGIGISDEEAANLWHTLTSCTIHPKEEGLPSHWPALSERELQSLQGHFLSKIEPVSLQRRPVRRKKIIPPKEASSSTDDEEVVRSPRKRRRGNNKSVTHLSSSSDQDTSSYEEEQSASSDNELDKFVDSVLNHCGEINGSHSLNINSPAAPPPPDTIEPKSLITPFTPIFGISSSNGWFNFTLAADTSWRERIASEQRELPPIIGTLSETPFQDLVTQSRNSPNGQDRGHV